MLTILVVSMLVAPGHQGSTNAPEAVAVVDGSRTPEAIPEWLAWESGFQTLLLVSDRPDSNFTSDLRQTLSEAEMELLQRAAEQQRAAHTRASESAGRLRQKLAADPSRRQAVADELHAVNLQYRRAVLAARDEALGRLRGPAQSAVLAWIGEVRTTIKFTVPKSELEQFRMPQ
jgi:hypothetical protein